VVLVTAHSGIDYRRIADGARLVVDFRNEVGTTGARHAPERGAYATV
jgi:hypothetical protein